MKKINFGFLKKRQTIITALIILVAVAGYFNMNYDITDTQTQEMPVSKEITPPDTEETVEVSQKADFFEEERLERDKSTSKSIEANMEIIENTSGSNEAKKQAEETTNKLSDSADKQTKLEGLIKSKGYEDAICYITENNVSIIVKGTEKLNPVTVAQIKDLAVNITGFSAENIKISEVD